MAETRRLTNAYSATPPLTTAPPTLKVDARLRDVSPRSAGQQLVGLVAFVAVVGAVAAVGSLASADAISEWYDTAPKPMWTPPNAVFGPVWTVLYLTMAVAAWLVWRRPDSSDRTHALRAYAAQLALNAVWSPVFFVLGGLWSSAGLWLALGIIVAVNFAILATIIRFAEVSRLSSWMLVPYWFWALFATTLNAAMAVLSH